ncbi:MAG TPA: flagellar hook-basal body complex protein FliE [Epsilonproteobacteria bacterium]|jgi:flagellar hook-basal body complex protein FliE|nr:flagellar hook-basal body complex protein FliE [Campylobacterota bacterium]
MAQAINSISPISIASVSKQTPEANQGSDFLSVLKASLGEVNDMQIKGDEALRDIATGQIKDLHQAAIAIDKAEISMKMMLEIRNKALNAYKEILRTQV